MCALRPVAGPWYAAPMSVTHHRGVLLGLAAALWAATASGEPRTRVFLNGVPTPVYFNDGDSFRVLEGPLRGTRARIAGFNTLESYGPVHMWGTWTPEELYRYAKLGTLNARRGVWHCTSDMKKDGYGRILWHCQDLAVDQIRKGLAHAMTVTRKPAPAPLLEAQWAALKARRGMWSHGIPPFVLTSTHSAAENFRRGPYNRLVSTADGHPEKFKHRDAYRECQWVCQPVQDRDPKAIERVAAKLGVDPALVEEFARTGRLGREDRHEDAIARAIARGDVRASGVPVACMRYVNFRRRYGPNRAACLR